MRFDLVLLVRPSIGEVLAFNACAARSSVMPRANRSALAEPADAVDPFRLEFPYHPAEYRATGSAGRLMGKPASTVGRRVHEILEVRRRRLRVFTLQRRSTLLGRLV